MAEYIEKVEYIEKGTLYEKIAELEEIARDRYINTPWDSPARTRYQTQLLERTNLKHIIFDLPASDVATVRHGKWIKYEDDSWECSECHSENCYAYDKNLKRFTDLYCHNCGAKMDRKVCEQE